MHVSQIVAVSQLVVVSQIVVLKQLRLPQCPLRLLTRVHKRPASVASFRPVLFTFAELRDVNALTFQA